MTNDTSSQHSSAAVDAAAAAATGTAAARYQVFYYETETQTNHKCIWLISSVLKLLTCLRSNVLFIDVLSRFLCWCWCWYCWFWCGAVIFNFSMKFQLHSCQNTFAATFALQCKRIYDDQSSTHILSVFHTAVYIYRQLNAKKLINKFVCLVTAKRVCFLQKVSIFSSFALFSPPVFRLKMIGSPTIFQMFNSSKCN